MIQDFFSIDRKGKNYFLFRIFNKVDFEEEVVYARDASVDNEAQQKAFIEPVLHYLVDGFDSLENWKGDQEGFHSSIQHFGFENVVRSGNLIPLFLLRSRNDSPLLRTLFNGMEENAASLRRRVIDTEAGTLYQALLHLGAKTFKPKDRNANVPIPLGLAFDGKIDDIGAFLENYS